MQHIGTYAVEREVGHGATGTVYLARSRAGRAVAVKVVRHGTEGGTSTADRDRLRAAFEAARRVGGLHTAPVLDTGEDDDAVWFATAYVAAPTLAELLASHGPLPEDALRRLGMGLADALQSVHGSGLTHGDLKVSDVLMAEDGPRLRDFGLRAGPDGRQHGTPADDVHALGTVLTAAAGGDLTRLPASLRPVVTSCVHGDADARPDTDALIEAFGAPPRTDVPAGHTAGSPPDAQAAPPTAPPPEPPAGPPPAGPPAAPVTPPAGQGPGPYAPPPPAPAAVAPVPPPQGFGPAPTTPWMHGPPGPPGTAPGHPQGGVPAPGAVPDEELEFLAMDRRNDVVADAHGISFTAHGHHTDLAWSHIRFVQHRRDIHGSTCFLTLSLVLVNGAQLACRVSTRKPWELDQWAARLDAVLARFLPRPPQ